MKDKYIPDLIMSVLRSYNDDRLLSSPVFKVSPYNDCRAESDIAIRFCDLKEILDDIFKEEEK